MDMEEDREHCYHCGDVCGFSTVLYEEHTFCCQGCRTVYQILKDNKLENYYHLNAGSGIQMAGGTRKEYSHLDLPEVQEKILDFTDGNQAKVHFHLPQIHCSSCLWLLEHLHRIDPGIQRSRVDFMKREVRIVYSSQLTTLRKVVELLASIGYTPDLNLDKLEEEQARPVDRQLIYKIGLAGFTFGNIMLLSFPEYLGLSTRSDQTFIRFFGYLNLILSLPVVLYSGMDYLRSALNGLRERHLNIDVPVSIGILALFGRSVYEILSHTGAGYLDSLSGLIFFLLVGKWFQQKAYHSISFDRDYKSYFPMAATVVRGRIETSVTLDDLKKGDRIRVRNGELIPADAILLSPKGSLDYSFVTGESDPIEVESGAKVFAGGRQVGGTILLEVREKVTQSYLTSLWNDKIFDKEGERGQTSRIADRVASIFTWVILVVASVTLAYWLPIDTQVAWQSFTAVLIVACPCAVALSIPFTFGNVMRLLGNRHLYLRNSQVVEKLAEIDHIVFDKTGTITYAQDASVQFEGDELTEDDFSHIRSLVHQSSHPVSRQIEASVATADLLEVRDLQIIDGMGLSGMIGSEEMRVGSFSFVNEGDAPQRQGTWVRIGDKLKGAYISKGRYREGLGNVLDMLRGSYRLSLLTGDGERERPFIESFFGSESQIRFNQKPIEKLKFVRDRQADGERVLMVGDGLNDAGALKQSDVGLVITDQVNNFIPSCDAVLDASRFQELPQFLIYIRRSIKIVYAAYFTALLYNIVGLTFAVQGLLSPVIAAILMPLSSITVVLLCMSTSTYLAYRMKLLNEKEE